MKHNDIHLQKLAAWVAEWQLSQAIDSVAPPVNPDRPVHGLTSSPAIRPGTGDVLLLRPLTPLTRRRPIYVLVITRAERRGTLLVAPFSRFTVPATPEEVATGLPWPLAVLCLWLSQVVAASLLGAIAWPVRRLAAKERLAATDAEAARRGPPLCHPQDPRYEYLDEERPLWGEVRERGTAAWAKHDGKKDVFYAGGLAAESADNLYKIKEDE